MDRTGWIAVCAELAHCLNVVFGQDSGVSLSPVTGSPGINLESQVLGPLRIWHLIFICGTVVLIAVTIACCCVDIRIPRLTQEIEERHMKRKLNADYVAYLEKLPSKAAKGRAVEFEPKTHELAKPDSKNDKVKHPTSIHEAVPQPKGQDRKSTKEKIPQNATPLVNHQATILQMMQSKQHADRHKSQGSAALTKWLLTVPDLRRSAES